MAAMPARDVEELKSEVETAAETAPPESATAAEKFSAEGEIPAVAETKAAAAATASELAFDGQEKTPDAKFDYLDRGIHVDSQAYEADCVAAGRGDKFKPEWHLGYTSAKQFEQPFENKTEHDFLLKPGQSASEAVQAFLKGPTITDYRAAAVANDMDELRDTYGDQKFDMLFGSSDKTTDTKIPANQRLRISSAAYTTPYIEQMQAIADAHEAAERTPAELPEVAAVEARVEEKPGTAQLDQEPVVVAQELGLQQQDRELV